MEPFLFCCAFLPAKFSIKNPKKSSKILYGKIFLKNFLPYLSRKGKIRGKETEYEASNLSQIKEDPFGREGDVRDQEPT